MCSLCWYYYMKFILFFFVFLLFFSFVSQHTDAIEKSLRLTHCQRLVLLCSSAELFWIFMGGKYLSNQPLIAATLCALLTITILIRPRSIHNQCVFFWWNNGKHLTSHHNNTSGDTHFFLSINNVKIIVQSAERENGKEIYCDFFLYIVLQQLHQHHNK